MTIDDAFVVICTTFDRWKCNLNHVDKAVHMTEIAFPLILIENLIKTAHKLKTWCCQRDYVHLSLVVIYIFTPSCGFNVSQLVNLDCVSGWMFTKKTLHILGS